MYDILHMCLFHAACCRSSFAIDLLACLSLELFCPVGTQINLYGLQDLPRNWHAPTSIIYTKTI